MLGFPKRRSSCSIGSTLERIGGASSSTRLRWKFVVVFISSLFAVLLDEKLIQKASLAMPVAKSSSTEDRRVRTKMTTVRTNHTARAAGVAVNGTDSARVNIIESKLQQEQGKGMEATNDQQPSKQLKRQDEGKNNTKQNAYSWQLAACDPDQSNLPAYRFFLTGIYTAIYALRKSGSKADFHVWIEMIHGSPHKKLPPDEERVLAELGAQIHYLPTQPEQSFYRTQLQKFRLLGLEQYQHVWHLDADVLPLSNLDFVFDLMDQGILRSNVGFVGRAAPMNGGSFILSPYQGALREMNALIHKKEHSQWDPTVGWGHEIKAPDSFKLKRKEKHSWAFHGGNGDQGLLIYWSKYHQKDVSIILQNGKIDHWVAAKDGGDGNNQTVKLIETENNALEKLDHFPFPEGVCFKDDPEICQQPRPMRDFVHFTGGDRKPWYTGLPADFGPETYRRTVIHYWFSLLEEINQKHQVGLNLTRHKEENGDVFVKGYALLQSSQRDNQKTFTSLID